MADSANMLEQITTSLKQSENLLDSVAARNTETIQVYDNLSQVVQLQQEQSSHLHDQMRQYAELGSIAARSFTTMQNGFGNLQQGMEEQSRAVAKLTTEISRQLPESLTELENTLAGLTNKFARDYQAFLDRYRQLVADEE